MVLLGAFAGIAYVTGYTIVGSEVDDETRGRTFAFLQSGIRVILFAVIAVAPFLAAGFTALVHGVTGGNTLRIAHIDYDAVGYNFVLLLVRGRSRSGSASSPTSRWTTAGGCRCGTT